MESEEIKVKNSYAVPDLDQAKIKEANRNIIARGIIGFLKRKTVKGGKSDGSNRNIEGDKNGKNNSDINPSDGPHVETSS